jgi:hypothetical protein
MYQLAIYLHVSFVCIYVDICAWKVFTNDAHKCSVHKTIFELFAQRLKICPMSSIDELVSKTCYYFFCVCLHGSTLPFNICLFNITKSSVA